MLSKRAVAFALRAAFAAPSIDPAKIKMTKTGEPAKRQKHDNPSDVFKALLAAWKTIPIGSDDVKEHILSWFLNNETTATYLVPIMSYL